MKIISLYIFFFFEFMNNSPLLALNYEMKS